MTRLFTDGAESGNTLSLYPFQNNWDVSSSIKRSGSVVESDGIELRTSYSHCKSAEYVINPMTGLPWTTDEVDSLQAGVRIKN